MIVVVHVVLEPVVVDDSTDGDGLGKVRPESGSHVLIEVRDVSLADAAATTVGSSRAVVIGERSSWLASAEVDVVDVAPETSLVCWVRISEDLDQDLDTGDWITMRSVPVDARLGEHIVDAPVRRIG